MMAGKHSQETKEMHYFVNALRNWLGMEPLYGVDKKTRGAAFEEHPGWRENSRTSQVSDMRREDDR